MPTLQRRRLLFSGAPPIVYQFGPFRFGTDIATLLPSPYTEAGALGSLTISDAGNKFSTSGGRLQHAAGVTSEAYAVAGLARVAGRALVATVNWATFANFAALLWLRASAVVGGGYANAAAGWAVTGSNLETIVNGGVGMVAVLLANLVTATDYQFAIILRGTGAFYLIKGGIYTSWTLFAVDVADATATVYPSVYDFGNTVDAKDTLFVTDLGGPWASDYGIATQRLAGARAVNDPITHTPNALLEFVVTTLPSAGSIDVRFRVQDASNYWLARISTTGALSLIEVVATVETSRATAAGVIANGHRVVIVADGTTIAGYSNNASRWSYASASNFQAQASGLLASLGTGGAVSDIVTWPRNPALPSGV